MLKASLCAVAALLSVGHALVPAGPAPAPAPAAIAQAAAVAAAGPAIPYLPPTAAPAPAPALAPEFTNGNARCLLAFLLQHSEYSTLLSLVKAAPPSAGLIDKLQDTAAGITLFAPNNAAVNKTLGGLGLGLPGLLGAPDLVLQILQFHMLPNPIMYSQLKDGYSFNTLLPSSNFNQALTISRANDQVTLMGGKVPVLVQNQNQKICLDQVYPVTDMLIPPSAVSKR